MKTEKFDRKMRSQLRTLTTVAKDIEELANEFTSYRLQQAGLEKAARVYDAIYAMQYALDELMLESGEGANG